MQFRTAGKNPRKLSLHRFRPLRYVVAFVVAMIGVPVIGASPIASAQVSATFPLPNWVETTGSVAISSPTVATIEGVSAVIFGTESGYIYVVNAITGANLPGWPQPVEIAPGVPSAVESSPTVAYLDGKRRPPTIIVGAGSTYIANQQGGVVAFRENGHVRFTFQTKDTFGEWNNSPRPSGYSNSVFSTPAVGNITGSGQQDIVFGSYDHYLYALTPNGRLVKGFPFDSQDTIWSSPALYHVRGAHGLEDIFTGGDASGRDGCFGGFVYDFTYVNNAPKVVWQHCENQTIWSSPAVGVINASKRPVVVVGTGFGETPPYKSDTNRLFAFYAGTGKGVRGWPVKTSGPSFGSPAIGRLPGSNEPAVVSTSWCENCFSVSPNGSSMIYAWNGHGKMLWSQVLPGPNIFSSPVIVDLAGTGSNDVVIGSSAGLYPLGGATGAFMFSTTATAPINACSEQNSVAIANIPTKGWQMFETCGGPVQVTYTGRIYDYPLPATPLVTPPWPMWRHNAAHDGVATRSL